MKKLLTLAAAAAAGVVVWQRLRAERAERDLWAEATDRV
ncbi:DLW-39 family protein [Quadrisphaera sp. GCM10027208]